ncbi:TPA: hypothetical protein ACT91O_001540 [Proteus mirabilis]
MDKSRQQFEEWINKNHPKCSEYHKDIRLEAWQASRESLEVELPNKEPAGDDATFEEGLSDGYNNAIDDFKQILIRNGVKIKK